MVKNTGGKRTKSQGRKYVGTTHQRCVRYAIEEGEVYATVTKLFGGDNCEVMCADGETRLCLIRKKFRGRGKRDNNVSIGVWVLVGLRDWESSKRKKCDLLEVYSQTDKDTLRTNCSINLVALCKATEDNFDSNNNDVEFVNNNTATYANSLLAETKTLSTILDDDKDSVIDFDDI